MSAVDTTKMVETSKTICKYNKNKCENNTSNDSMKTKVISGKKTLEIRKNLKIIFANNEAREMFTMMRTKL